MNSMQGSVDVPQPSPDTIPMPPSPRPVPPSEPIPPEIIEPPLPGGPPRPVVEPIQSGQRRTHRQRRRPTESGAPMFAVAGWPMGVGAADSTSCTHGTH